MLVHEHILISDSRNNYRFSEPTIHLLHLVSGVEKKLIENTVIYSRSPWRIIPWYRGTKGGGAITLGSSQWQSITFTENFFSTDQDKFNGRAFGNKLDVWLRLAAHEVGHLSHAYKFKFLVIYLWIFLYQYIMHGHDKAPLEIEADLGSKNYSKFSNFLNRRYGQKCLETLISSESAADKKIAQLNTWWSEFKSQSEASGS